MEQYHIKCVETSNNLKRRGRKAFLIVAVSNLHPRVTVLCTLRTISTSWVSSWAIVGCMSFLTPLLDFGPAPD